MKCKFCGAELPDSAKFCLQCGKPLLEETKAEQDEGGGAETPIPALGGQWKDGLSATADAFRRQPLRRVGELFAVVGAPFALLFSFFIGLSVKGDTLTDDILSALGLNGLTTVDLPYLLWEEYEIFFSAFELNAETALQFTQMILNTLVTAGMLITVAVCAYKSIRNYMLSLQGAGGKDCIKPALTAWCAYAFGAAILSAMSAVSAKVIMNGMLFELHTTFNALTTTGLSLSGACLLLYAISAVLLQKGALTEKQSRQQVWYRAARLILLAAVFFLACNPGSGLRIGRDGTSITENMGFMPLLITVGQNWGFDFSAPIENLILFTAALAGLVLQTGLLLCVLSELLSVFGAHEKRKNGAKNSGCAGLTVFVSFLYLAAAVVAAVYYKECSVGTVDDAHIMFVIPVIVCVLTVIHYFLKKISVLAATAAAPALPDTPAEAAAQVAVAQDEAQAERPSADDPAQTDE